MILPYFHRVVWELHNPSSYTIVAYCSRRYLNARYQLTIPYGGSRLRLESVASVAGPSRPRQSVPIALRASFKLSANALLSHDFAAIEWITQIDKVIGSVEALRLSAAAGKCESCIGSCTNSMSRFLGSIQRATWSRPLPSSGIGWLHIWHICDLWLGNAPIHHPTRRLLSASSQFISLNGVLSAVPTG